MTLGLRQPSTGENVAAEINQHQMHASHTSSKIPTILRKDKIKEKMQKTSAPELTTRLSTITRERKDSWDQLIKIWRSAMVESPEKRATKQAAKNCKENLRHKKPHRTCIVSIIISGADDTLTKSQDFEINQKWILRFRIGRRSLISKGVSTPQNDR